MRGDFRLRDWLVQPMRGRIESSHASVQIEPKAMDLLAYLASRAGQVVTKQQIVQSVWEGAFVTDEVLTNSIYKLRQALGDDPKDPRFIQTVPRRGYQLIAPVQFHYDRALKEFHLARADRPNDSHVLAGMSYIRRRQGRFEEAAATLEQARVLDPRSAQVSRELAMTYHLMREWEKAEEQWDRTISLAPDLVTAHVLKAWLYIHSEGDVAKARRALKSVGDLGLEETPFFVEGAVHTEIRWPVSRSEIGVGRTH